MLATAKRLTTADLAPGDGLEPVGIGTPPEWLAEGPHVRFTADEPLEPGWYSVRLAVRSAGRFTVHKRAELVFEPADDNPRPPCREAFSWNRSFDERFMVKLTRPVRGVRLDLRQAEGRFTIAAFSVRRVSRPAAAARAVREKLRLVQAYQCLRPVLVNGGKMLLSGRFRTFGSKVLRGLTDAREMRTGAAGTSEADAAWWRRPTLPADEADAVSRACDTFADPPPIAVILPVDADRLDAARRSAHAVRRQLYPHWQLLVAAVGPAGLAPHLERLTAEDPRAEAHRVPTADGLAAALGKVWSRVACEHVLVVPPGVELAEHALYHLAVALKADPTLDMVGGRVAGMTPECVSGGTVWAVRAKCLSDLGPLNLSATAIELWIAESVSGPRTTVERTLAYPADDRPLADRARVAAEPLKQLGTPLAFAADVRGVGGYDHLAVALLKGLPSAGFDLTLHPTATVRADLVPDAVIPKVAERTATDPQLIVAPPFLVHRFQPDRRTAVLTMWETDELGPAEVKVLNRAGLVIVPSEWQKECFRACGVTVPLGVAPLGYDPLAFYPSGPAPTVCTFGTAGALSAGGLRKNAQWVIDLFRRAFPVEPDVRLKIKITPNSPGVETFDDPRIDVTRAILSPAELADWYRSLTAYWNGSHGEGFGLHLIEAMACGRPLITPCHSGLTAFFDPTIGYAVDYQLVNVPPNEIYAGRWAEAEEHSVIARLREVYADRTAAERLGQHAATRATRFTWKASGRALAELLRAFAG